MKIRIREKEGITILDLQGNIDINASDFVEAVGWALRYKSKDILCNFGDVNLVDYVGISVIAVVYKNVLNHKGKMKVCNVPSHVRNLFAIVGLNRVFTYYQSEEEAMRSFKEEKKIFQILEKKLRRRFQRIPFRTTIEYKQKFSPKDIFYKGKILNLSAIGVFIVAKKIFSVEEILTTRINLSPKPGIIDIDAKVVWVADQQIQPLEYPGMGLQFYNIDPKTQERIIEFVEKHLTHSSSQEY
jgi:stage II sporulation protein AA (anti-sigma F factor antagonist)